MQIARLPKIKNFRIFHDFSWPDDLPDFGRFNLLYGWNGSGKTTLSTLFRHLQEGSPLGNGEARVVIDGRETSIGVPADGASRPIRVFNRDFIGRSIFESGGLLSPIYYLGEASVEEQKRLTEIRAELEQSEASLAVQLQSHSRFSSDKEKFCQDQARLIKQLLTAPGGGPYNNYDSRMYRTSMLALLHKDKAPPTPNDDEISSYLAQKDAKPKPQIEVPRFELPDVPSLYSSIQELLNTSVVSASLETLTADPQLAHWISHGLNLHAQRGAGHCFFCEQPLPSGRLERLTSHFNDEYNQFQERLQQECRSLAETLSRLESFQPPADSLLYENLAENYRKAVGTFTVQRGGLANFFRSLIAAVESKKSHPFERLELRSYMPNLGTDTESSVLMHILDFATTTISAISAQFGQSSLEQMATIISQHNAQTDRFNEMVEQAREKLEQGQLLNTVDRFNELLNGENSAAAEVRTLREQIDRLKREGEKLDADLKQHTVPALELNRELKDFLGRDEVQFVAKKGGYTLTRAGVPAQHLSEGERTAIAFMYFLKSLRDSDFDLSSGVVVIDDPVSSLDASSLFTAFGYMKQTCVEAGQLFVLTHNFDFFREVRYWLRKLPGRVRKDVQFYMLSPEVGDGRRSGSLVPLDPLLKDYESEYQYLFKRVYEEASTDARSPLETLYPMPNIARRVLEAFLMFKAPDAGNLHERLERVDPANPARRARVLRLLESRSHLETGMEPRHDLTLLGEVRTVLKDVLNLMAEADEGHFSAMVGLVKPDLQRVPPLPAQELAGTSQLAMASGQK